MNDTLLIQPSVGSDRGQEVPGLTSDRFPAVDRRHAGGGTAAGRLRGEHLGRVAIRNVRLRGVLERVAAKFNEANVPLLVMKGSALTLNLYGLNERPMDDIDLLVRPEHLAKACRLLEQIGASRGCRLLSDDFCPRFHYEMEFFMGTVYPVKIDLHVRPFRPLRYSRLVPPEALWARSQRVSLGDATILVPSTEEMLIHLVVHAAIHGCSRRIWLQDIKLWSEAQRAKLDWPLLLETVQRWGLAWPFRRGIECAAREFGPLCPEEVMHRISRLRGSWRDRLVLWQAPRDAKHPLAHVLVNVFCTPGWRFSLAYLCAVVFGNRSHPNERSSPRHRFWRPAGHFLRWFGAPA